MRSSVALAVLAVCLVTLFPGAAQSATLDWAALPGSRAANDPPLTADTPPALANPATAGDAELFATQTALSDTDLADQRGGFVWAGMTISFGADIRTFLNGALVLQTIISWTDAGAITQQTVSPELAVAGAPELVNGLLSTGSIRMRVGDQTVFLANGGRTAILHNYENNLQSVLINTASNISIDHQVDATLSLGNYDSFRDQIIYDRVSSGLDQAVASATYSAMGF